MLMSKLLDSDTEYVYKCGASRGNLTIRIDGELVFQKAPGRSVENPQPTPQEFAEITAMILARSNVDAAILPHEAKAFGILHDAMVSQLRDLVAAGELSADGEKTGAYQGAASKREMTAEEAALAAAQAAAAQ